MSEDEIVAHMSHPEPPKPEPYAPIDPYTLKGWLLQSFAQRSAQEPKLPL